MTQLVSSYVALASTGELLPYRDELVLGALLLALVCMLCAASSWVAARRRGWVARLRLEE